MDKLIASTANLIFDAWWMDNNPPIILIKSNLYRYNFYHNSYLTIWLYWDAKICEWDFIFLRSLDDSGYEDVLDMAAYRSSTVERFPPIEQIKDEITALNQGLDYCQKLIKTSQLVSSSKSLNKYSNAVELYKWDIDKLLKNREYEYCPNVHGGLCIVT
ncbi:MAG: hypothetical protein LBP59_10750 [Planctomycetaceae bacterium]|jgi:hypothetical protein|nr:hypothetical protein [Planctomycetaceae bacterium]